MGPNLFGFPDQILVQFLRITLVSFAVLFDQRFVVTHFQPGLYGSIGINTSAVQSSRHTRYGVQTHPSSSS